MKYERLPPFEGAYVFTFFEKFTASLRLSGLNKYDGYCFTHCRPGDQKEFQELIRSNFKKVDNPGEINSDLKETTMKVHKIIALI